MKFLCLHLSDIHFCNENNSILEKEDALFDIVKNSTKEFEFTFLIVSGDSSFSGKKSEYDRAEKFIESLKRRIIEYSQKGVYVVVIPGNHDCNFLEKNNQARQNQVNAIQKLGDSIIDDSVIHQCVAVQEEYFEFENSIISAQNLIFSHNLLKIFEFLIEENKILFYCYNTAYLSEIKEQAGKMYFPISLLPTNIFELKADLIISIFHHPFNWYSPINRREFFSHIHKTSDFYLTGHEHELSKSMIDDLEGNIVYHIEGSVLQDSEDKFQSEFNMIAFDLEAISYKSKTIFWSGDKYLLNSNPNNWTNYRRGKFKLKNKYSIELEYKKRLEDIGGKFTHPNSQLEISLSDLFVYPKLRFFNNVDSVSDTISYLYEDAESIITNLGKQNRILFFGEETVGKTSLLKQAYQYLYKKGFVSVFLDGFKIKNSSIADFKELVKVAFIEQYGIDSLEDFDQEDLQNVYIIIDDYDKTLIRNQKAKGKLIKSLI